MPVEDYVGTNGPTIEYIEDVGDLVEILERLLAMVEEMDDEVQQDACAAILARAIDDGYDSEAYSVEPEDDEGVEDEYDEGGDDDE